MIKPTAKEIATKLNGKVGRVDEIMFAYRKFADIEYGTGWWNGMAFSYAERKGWFIIFDVVKTLYPDHLTMHKLKLGMGEKIHDFVRLRRVPNDPERVCTIFMQEYVRSKRYQKSLFPRIWHAGTIYTVIDEIAKSCRGAPLQHRMRLALTSYKIMQKFKLSATGG